MLTPGAIGREPATQILEVFDTRQRLAIEMDMYIVGTRRTTVKTHKDRFGNTKTKKPFRGPLGSDSKGPGELVITTTAQRDRPRGNIVSKQGKFAVGPKIRDEVIDENKKQQRT